MPPILFATNSYQARALPLNAQRLVNYYAEQAPPDSKSPVVVYNAPGIKSLTTGLAGAIRGSAVRAGVLYVIAGNMLLSSDSAGTATTIGSIDTTSGRVSMAVNRASPQELCIVDGTDGWIYNGSTLTKISDGDFKAADTVAFLDGYFIFNESGTSNFFISALDDGTSYSSTDFADAEGSPDNVVAVISDHRELWVFGEETIEIYFNSGDADFPFDRISGAFIERGCAAAFSIATEDNRVFWLGDDNIVYGSSGYRPARISTHAIEEAIRKMSSRSDAFAFIYTIEGHKFYVLTFPTGERTFIYDIATTLWHERESLDSEGNLSPHWRASTHNFVYDKHIMGDAFQGRLGELDLDTFAEFGVTMQGIATAPPIQQDRKRLFHRRLEIEMEAGVGTTSGTTSDPQVWLDYSDDGGRTFSLRKPFRAIGKIGAYGTRLRWLRLGWARERVYRLTVADAVKRSIVNAHVDVEVGSH